MSERPPLEPRNGEPRVEWTAAERAALARLRAALPPADLEESVVAALTGQGLVGPGGPVGRAAGGPREPQPPRVPAHRAWAWGALALAACLAAFVAGISVSDRGAGRAPTGPATADVATTERYLLLLYEDESYQAPATPEEHAARVAEYSGWVDDLRQRGIDIAGEELAPPVESEWLDGREGGIEATEGAPGGPAGTLAGYFLVEAPDAAAAMAIARTTPHLKHGGTVVVRRIVEH
jgi:hypothetical protein